MTMHENTNRVPGDDGADELLACLVARFAPFEAFAERVSAHDDDVSLGKDLADGILEFASDLRETRRRVTIGE